MDDERFNEELMLHGPHFYELRNKLATEDINELKYEFIKSLEMQYNENDRMKKEIKDIKTRLDMMNHEFGGYYEATERKISNLTFFLIVTFVFNLVLLGAFGLVGTIFTVFR